MARVAFWQGNEAILEGAIAAGARFYAGYPITPSSEIAEGAAARLPALQGVYLQMEDELASMAAIIGASLAGIKSFTATSGPGFSLMQENLGLAVMAEVPCVVINVQRSGPSTGLATKPAQADVMQARWGTHGDHAIIVLSPASVQECFELTIKAFNFSERYRTPVILLADEVIGHLRERVEVPAPEKIEVWARRFPSGPPEAYLPYRAGEDGVPPLAFYGSAYVFHANSSMHGESGYPENSPANAGRVIGRLYDKIYRHQVEVTLYQEFRTEDAEILLVSYGGSARAAQAALQLGRRAGLKMGLLQLNTLWPFPDELVAQRAGGKRLILVPEMNLGQLVHEVTRVVRHQVPVHGVNKSNGEPLTPEEILERARELYT
ncbi:MAG: 2-oxoacid:acceptor oxidoreductase subunit alpha [Firmicutes bacterium]|nr:2-oxoacid:acceptor oxidoreductase subunit alpha [Bacillota bacterium]